MLRIIGWAHDSHQRKKAFLSTLSRSLEIPAQNHYPVISSHMVSLGTLSGNEEGESAALGLSKNQEIVGWSIDPDNKRSKAFVHLIEGGMRDLRQMLRQRNDRENWALTVATAISEDGNYIVGKGIYTPSTYVRKNNQFVRIVTGPPREKAFIMCRNTGAEVELEDLMDNIMPDSGE